MSPALRFARISILVAAIVFGLKALAWALTGSIALLSDALESTINLATALVTLLAIHIAARPADATHPYGHHKAEIFSAALEGLMILLAALFILHAAYDGLRAPPPTDIPLGGIALNALATALNALWARCLIRQGTRLRSPALTADGKHLATDVITSLGVALGVLLARVTGWPLLDPLIAAAVGLHILGSGIFLLKGALSSLMDEALPEATLARIRAIIRTKAKGAVEAHDLRTRHAGSATFIDFHLVVPGRMPVFEAHAICDEIEAAIAEIIPGAQTTIHIEPEDKAKGAAHPHKTASLRISKTGTS